MRFNRDRRGQSVVVGTVILFGFLILAISLYQVQIVPQENAQVEFEHFQEVRNDMVDLRAGILQAGSTDRRQYQTVQLGTTYPPRLFAINPPAPSGTIRTSDPYPITISNGTSEGTVTVPTRFIQYRPGYHEIEESPTWYDASVLYLDARGEGGEVAVLEDQNLVSDGKVQIVAVQNEFRRSGTGQVTLELYPAENVTETIPDGNLTVTVPTRLSDEYWSETDIRSDTYSITSDANDDDVYNLTLETTANDLTVDTVGVQEAPEEATQEGDGVGGGGDGGSGGGGTGDGSDGSDGASFESLSAEVTQSSSSGIGEVTFDYQLSEATSGVSFTVTDARGVTNTETGSGNTGEQTQEVSIDKSSGNNRPVTVTANINGGGCQTATLEETDSTAIYPGDWNPC
ncbi:hypothetical protein EXE53_17750 [Halorubrum sp. SD626R]|uniref:hypothetical protein n=1 Tax=Halorubrum sp. SD626R TaxID=1419722 RepID=UPI0010F7AD4D|nr:hypothetical protein [Halorubrum sp. SD626R]TKX79089.1 hypothetical protein EXE53_17750 [Halorubrum sp. SD626R]